MSSRRTTRNSHRILTLNSLLLLTNITIVSASFMSFTFQLPWVDDQIPRPRQPPPFITWPASTLMPKDRTGYAEMLAAQAKDDLPEGSAGVVMAQEESVREEWVEEVAITAQ